MRTSLCVRDKYSSRFGRHQVRSRKKMKPIETNSVTSMEIFSSVIPLTSGTKSTFKDCHSAVCASTRKPRRGKHCWGAVPLQLPSPTCSVPWRCFHRLASEVLNRFAFRLKLHLCVLTEHCRFLLSSFFVHC